MERTWKRKALGWLGLAGSLFATWVFMVHVAPQFKRIERVRVFADYVAQEDINVGAIWWSDVEQTADAEHGARSTMAYLPRGGKELSTHQELGTLEFMQR